jgi:hypothetical protein
MERAIWSVMLTLVVVVGCSDSPVAPSMVSDERLSPRVAPFRNQLNSVPRTIEGVCRELAAPTPQPASLIGVPPSPPVLPPPPPPPPPRFRGPNRFGVFDPSWRCSHPR